MELQVPGTVYGADGTQPGSEPRLLPFSLPLCQAVVTNSDVFIKWVSTAAAATSVGLPLLKRFCFWPVARLLDPPSLWCREGRNDAADAKKNVCSYIKEGKQLL